VHGVPPALAQAWESQASSIAAAADTGNDCHALQLARSLREDVRAAELKLPQRLRSPLAVGVESLVHRLTCRPPVTSPPPPPQPPPKQRPHDDHGHHDHGHHDHGHHGHGNDQGDQGGDG
jgi:hypothetical protein